MAEKKLDEPAPKGLEIKGEKGKENITITLGDDVDFKQIVDYLVDKKHITQAGQDDEGIYKLANDTTKITIKMCGKDQNDTYSITMQPYGNGKLFKCDKKYKYIFCEGDGIGISKKYHRFKCRNNYIVYREIDNKNLLTNSSCSLVKDIKGNLSWFKPTKDGKVYMCNAKDNKNSDPEHIDDKEWKPIRHTFRSNVNDWYWHNFDDFDDEIKKQTSKIKRFGKLFICQQNMTGDWLCGTGCCSCTNSGYNEYDFYKEKQNDNKESGSNIDDNLSQNIID
ncbi:MAG: hypothetical protein IJT15_02250 [Rickettsiales bacterium]|nr:hypothetical protein [Rickettsiales bacterium]